MTVCIEGHDCMLFGDRDRPILPTLSFRGKVRWFELRLRHFLIAPLEKLRPRGRSRTESDLGSLLAFGYVLFGGVEALGTFCAGKDGTAETFSSFVITFMNPALKPYTRQLRDHFRNGLAHGLAIKQGGFEYDLGSLVRVTGNGAIQIDPDLLLGEFRRGLRSYVARLRAQGPASKIGRNFLVRFAAVFE